MNFKLASFISFSPSFLFSSFSCSSSLYWCLIPPFSSFILLLILPSKVFLVSLACVPFFFLSRFFVIMLDSFLFLLFLLMNSFELNSSSSSSPISSSFIELFLLFSFSSYLISSSLSILISSSSSLLSPIFLIYFLNSLLVLSSSESSLFFIFFISLALFFISSPFSSPLSSPIFDPFFSSLLLLPSLSNLLSFLSTSSLFFLILLLFPAPDLLLVLRFCPAPGLGFLLVCLFLIPLLSRVSLIVLGSLGQWSMVYGYWFAYWKACTSTVEGYTDNVKVLVQFHPGLIFVLGSSLGLLPASDRLTGSGPLSGGSLLLGYPFFRWLMVSAD